MIAHPTPALGGTFLGQVIGGDGMIRPEVFSVVLHVSRTELAAAAGLSRNAVSKSQQSQAAATQARLREIAEVINRILPWCGSVQQAFAWYRSQPIPAFGDLTAEDLVRAGRGEDLRGYLSGIAAGGYA